MSFNLVDAAKGLFTNDLIGKASSFLGESENGVSKAIGGIVPTVLSGLINKADTHDGANKVAQLAGEQYRSGLLDNLGSVFSGGGSSLLNTGTGLLSSLFGNKGDTISSLISGFSGIKSSSATSLLSLAAPAILGLLGRHASSNNLSAGGLASLLSSQKNAVAAATPPGLNLNSILSGAGDYVKSTAATVTREVEEKKGGMGWLWPLLLLALLAIGAYYLLGKGCGKHEDTVSVTDTTVTNTTATMDTTVTTTAPAARETFKVKLANGVEIDAYKGGIEDKLVTFLGTDYKALGEDSLKKLWFDFDDLNFETGKATITAESKRQLDNIIAILRAYPAVKLKIGGYTDKTGNEDANKKLSAARANAVKDAISKAGLGTQITGAEGYGSDFAKYAADAPESDRVKDRHVSVSVRP